MFEARSACSRHQSTWFWLRTFKFERLWQHVFWKSNFHHSDPFLAMVCKGHYFRSHVESRCHITLLCCCITLCHVCRGICYARYTEDMLYGYLYAVTYHLGSLLYGSFLCTLFRVLRMLAAMLVRASEETGNPVATCFLSHDVTERLRRRFVV
jgi:hypothetical protein